MRIRRGLFAVMILGMSCGLAACGGGYGVGAGCSSDGQCAAGLACITNKTPLSCQENGETCNIVCTSDQHCIDEFGDGYVCIGGCGATSCFEL